WDAALPLPRIEPAWFETRRADVVHGGLTLGTTGRPAIIDYIQPTWMWTRDPDPTIEATSWRVSLRACVIRSEAIRQLGRVRPEFQTLAGAALELGHRYLRRGAFVRHDPSLAPPDAAREPGLPLFDEILFARLRYSDFWARWALGRGLVHGEYRARDVAS